MKNPRIEIHYCIGCHWMLRAGWLAQELLSTFEKDLGEVALIPSIEGGTFLIKFNQITLWERVRDDGFPEAKILKRLVRDQLDTKRSLGHIDR